MPPLSPDIDKLVDRLGLSPHPEGGMYAETYRSSLHLSAQALSPEFPAARPASTAILFLLPRGSRSRMHRIRSDELWHFHLGGPLTIHEISPDGSTRRTVLGPDVLADQVVQHTVPAGSWFGAMLSGDAPYTLVGCTVAPGFDFADFEMGSRRELLQAFPRAAESILSLTDPDDDAD